MPELAEGLFVDLERGEKLISKRFWREKDLKTLVSKIVSGGLNCNAIVAVHPYFIFETNVSVSALREKSKDTISATELENILVRFVGKFFNQCRLEAAKYLGVDDLDVILVGSRVSNFRLDGRRVINPIGLEAGRIEFILEFTFTTRVIFEEIKPLKRFFFTDALRSGVKVLDKIYRPPTGLLVLERDRSYFVTLSEFKEIGWQSSLLIRSISDIWAVSSQTAAEIYSAYLGGDVSPAVARVIAGKVRSVIQSFFKTFLKLRPRGKIFLDSDIQLPLNFPVRKRSFFIQKIDFREIMFKLGFEGNLPFRWFSPLAVFLSDKGNLEVNHWLRRYLNWLGSPV